MSKQITKAELFKTAWKISRMCVTFNEIFKVFSGSLKMWHSRGGSNIENGVELNRIKNNKHQPNTEGHRCFRLQPNMLNLRLRLLRYVAWDQPYCFSASLTPLLTRASKIIKCNLSHVSPRERFAGFNFPSASGSNLIFIDGVTSERIIAKNSLFRWEIRVNLPNAEGDSRATLNFTFSTAPQK